MADEVEIYSSFCTSRLLVPMTITGIAAGENGD
jgi:hypothetical protein